MKNYQLLLLSTLLAAPVATTAVRAEDPPPLPPNPFSNLPANNDSSFDNPFEDEEGEDASEQAPQAAGRPAGAGARRNNNANSNRGASGSPGTLPNQPALDAPNAKDIVDNFDYPDAEILDVAKAIAKLTRKNFIYNPQDIKGRISVVSQTPITVGDAWNAFLTAINMKGFALVPSGKYLRIERIANAKEKQTPIYAGKKAPSNDEFITRVLPLRYIDATEFEQAFRLWMPREARMQAYAQTNTIIITDTSSHINRMMELINLLDVAGYQESLVVIPVRNAPAKDLAKLMEQILNEGRTAGAAGARAGGNFSAGRATTPRRGRSGGSTISKIIADDRTNALIVKANAAGLQEIRALVRRLDTKVAPSEGSGRLHVIPLQYADAEAMAKTLQAITGGGASGARSGSTRGFPSFGDQQAVFQNEIKVAPDKATQSIVVTASPQDYLTVKKVVEQLDLPRDQVFIEAMILEMRLTGNNSRGTSFVSARNGVALPGGGLASLLAGNPLGIGGFALGFKSGPEQSIPITGTDGSTSNVKVNSLNGLLTLITTNTDSNVVATPQIIALDNEEATFEISEEIKLPTLNTANNGITSTSFTPEKAQTLLKVTPQINKASNFVKLNIDQKLENFDDSNVPAQLVGQTKGKNIRSTQTKVIVQNEDTVVLSGLMRDDVRESENKVPVLGDIPVLGWLFKNTKTEKVKTNLLVFITPRIIKQYDSIRKVLDRKLDEREEFIRENLGARDPNGKIIAKMKKELPELTVIEPLPRKEQKESSNQFPSPSSQDSRDYGDDQYYDPENFYYPPEGGAVPLPPIDSQMPMIDMPQNDAFPPAPITPNFDNGGGME
ncbi:MAG: type II secretion system protein GspD [Proteobacteria bacterium]|nr:MAG: type II secretion system protein GspD [Pseudomonadota bacterium]